MNPTKFYERTKLFNEIINEINQVEINYCTELKNLNIKIAKKIEEYKLAINQKLTTEISRKTITKKSKTIKNEETKNNKKNTIEFSKTIKENMIISKEENPMIDKLISEGLQNLLNFYQNKCKIISKQVSNLGTILYKFTSTQKKYDPDIIVNVQKCGKDFDINYIKLMKVKQAYFKKMCEFEIYLHQQEKDKKIEQLENVINDNQEKEKGTNINNNNEPLTEEQKIEELINLRQNYKKYLVRLSYVQKEYIDKINEIGNDIKCFNIDENNLLYNILKTFEENDLAILKELNNFCLLYEHNKKLIDALNLELSNTLINDDRIYTNYVFEEFVPKFKSIKDQKDLLVIQKMNESIGFEFDKIKTNNSNNEEKNDCHINYQNIDNNLLFILLMGKFTNGETLLTKKEKDMLMNLFNDEKYMSEFLLKLNKIRMNNYLFKHRENFDNLIEFFNYIFSKISLTDEHTHELIKVLMILSETFFYKDGDNKIFLINSINVPKEVRESEFWKKYLEYEINIEAKKYDKKRYSRYEYIVLISHTTHLKEFGVPKEKIVEIVDFFKNKYNFTNEEMEIIKDQLNLE
jgi:hypothetical protein